jgi:hypothetical protein
MSFEANTLMEPETVQLILLAAASAIRRAVMLRYTQNNSELLSK